MSIANQGRARQVRETDNGGDPLPERVLYRPAGGLWIVIFVAVASVLVVGGYAYYRYETDRIRQEKYQDLRTIANLKANQIREWRQERLADVSTFSKAPFFGQGLQEWLRDRANPSLRTKVRDRLVLQKKEQGYADVLLLDTECRVLVSADSHPPPLSPKAKQVAERVLANHTPMLSHLYRGSNGLVCMDAVAPIIDNDGRPVAVLILRTNAQSLLYPVIQSWPTHSKTAETLLVRKEGEGILFLNDLRFRPHAALSLREPLTLTDLPAVQAVLGKRGMFQGKDYRGVEVLADLRAVPDSPWFMVAKVDTSEILAEARYRGGVVVLFVAIFVILAASITAFGYRYLQAHLYRDLYRWERSQREAQEKFRTTLYSIGDAVITTDVHGHVEQMNPVAERLTGWSEDKARGKPLPEVFRVINEHSREVVDDPVKRVLSEGMVVGLANHTLLIGHDGTEYPIADSGAPIRDPSGSIIGVVLVFRDQTEERRAQAALEANEETVPHRSRLYV